jgi:hypothetical protein
MVGLGGITGPFGRNRGIGAVMISFWSTTKNLDRNRAH